MTVKVNKIHDFTAKLRQPYALSRLKKYVEWQKAIRLGLEVETPNLIPLSINLDLTTACNFHCDHCIDLGVINSKDKFDHGKLLASLDNMIEHGLRSVTLIGGGEPTLYPRFIEIVKFLKKRDIQVAIVSNGSRGEKLFGAAKYLKSEHKDWLRLSIDAGTDNTWKRIHEPLPNITLAEVCSWAPKIHAINPQLQIGFSFLITWDNAKNEKGISIIKNFDEIADAVKLAHEYGFNYISLKPILTRLRADSVEAIDPIADSSIIARIRETINEAKDLYENEYFKIIESTNLKVLEDGSWHEFTNQPKICHMAVFRQVLSPIGLFHCPGFRGIKKSYISDKNAYCDKNMKHTQKAVVNILAKFDAGKECADCTCLLNQPNWWIEMLINDEIDMSEIKPTEERLDYFF